MLWSCSKDDGWHKIFKLSAWISCPTILLISLGIYIKAASSGIPDCHYALFTWTSIFNVVCIPLVYGTYFAMFSCVKYQTALFRLLVGVYVVAVATSFAMGIYTGVIIDKEDVCKTIRFVQEEPDCVAWRNGWNNMTDNWARKDWKYECTVTIWPSKYDKPAEYWTLVSIITSTVCVLVTPLWQYASIAFMVVVYVTVWLAVLPLQLYYHFLSRTFVMDTWLSSYLWPQWVSKWLWWEEYVSQPRPLEDMTRRPTAVWRGSFRAKWLAGFFLLLVIPALVQAGTSLSKFEQEQDLIVLIGISLAILCVAAVTLWIQFTISTIPYLSSKAGWPYLPLGSFVVGLAALVDGVMVLSSSSLPSSARASLGTALVVIGLWEPLFRFAWYIIYTPVYILYSCFKWIQLGDDLNREHLANWRSLYHYWWLPVVYDPVEHVQEEEGGGTLQVVNPSAAPAALAARPPFTMSTREGHRFQRINTSNDRIWLCNIWFSNVPTFCDVCRRTVGGDFYVCQPCRAKSERPCYYCTTCYLAASKDHGLPPAELTV